MYVNAPFRGFLQLGYNALKPRVCEILVIQRIGVVVNPINLLSFAGTQPDSKIKSESSESNQFCRKIGPINYSRCLLFLCFMESNTTFPNHEKVTTKQWKELQFSPFEVSILSSLLTALLCRLTHARCTLIQRPKRT